MGEIPLCDFLERFFPEESWYSSDLNKDWSLRSMAQYIWWCNPLRIQVRGSIGIVRKLQGQGDG